MKNKLNKIIGVSTVLILGGAFTLNAKAQPMELLAVDYPQNFDSYTYNGSYYASISSNLTEGMNGTLRSALTTLILPKDWYTYSGSKAGTLGLILQSADEDPRNSNNMVLLYTRESIVKQASSNDAWNREHVWPRSLSHNNWQTAAAGADLLHIRPTWYSTNSARGDKKYADVNKANPQTYNGITYAYISGNYFEPIDAAKGDIARILMYVWTAYRDYYHDDNLLITNTITDYDTLLKWHTMDKPDILEGNRNNYSENSIQKNRNPFVDHPEYAWKIFGSEASKSVTDACKEAYPERTDVTPTPSSSSAPTESMTPTTSTPTATSEQSSEVPIPKNNSGIGCSGSILGVASMTTLTTLVGMIFVLSKKKK